jgi:hypothetical protein
MNHQDAIREMAVERYLLGELSGVSLDRFEEHLFECPECAIDVKNGTTFIDATRSELSAPRKITTTGVESVRKWISWFANPWILAPALAACLLILAFQTFVIQPRRKLELAQAQMPRVLSSLVLANAGARGDSIPEVIAPEHGSFVISLDVPTNGSFSKYRCSLFALDGAVIWQTIISAEQARDALLISMPTDKTKDGLNAFLIQGQTAGGTLEDLAKYRFRVKIQK